MDLLDAPAGVGQAVGLFFGSGGMPPLYLTNTGRSDWLAGAALSVVEAAGIAGAFAGGWVSDHVGRRPVLVFGFATAPVALLLFLATDGAMQIALLAVIGLTLLSVPPVLMALVQEQVPDSRALANGVYLSMNFAIRSVGAIVFGAVGDAFGLKTAMTISAFAMFLGLPLIWLLFKPRAATAQRRGTQDKGSVPSSK